MAPLSWIRKQFQSEPLKKPPETEPKETSPKENQTPTQLQPEDRQKEEEEKEEEEQKRKILEGVSTLEKVGLPHCAHEIADFTIKFSTIDGTDLRTPEARLAQIEKLQNLEGLDKEWYEKKGPNYDKGYGISFISEKGIPEALKKERPLGATVKQFHRWHMAGSPKQLEVLQYQKYDIVGEYRHARVSIGRYPLPEPEDVQRLMELLEQQVENFSTQVEKMKESLPPEEFEDKIFRYACYILHRFTEIHPMADGNGRVARSLYEMTIVKHVGKDSKYRHLPLTKKDDFSLPREIKLEQQEIISKQILNLRETFLDYNNGDTELSEFDPLNAPTMKALKQTSVEETVYNDKNFDKFVDMMKEWVNQPTK